MSLLLAEIARQGPEHRHAVVRIANAGWHTTDKIAVSANLTVVNLQPYSPALNTIERVGPYPRDRYLSGCLVTDAAIVEACCDTWNSLLDKIGRIRSLTARPWHVRSIHRAPGIRRPPERVRANAAAAPAGSSASSDNRPNANRFDDQLAYVV